MITASALYLGALFYNRKQQFFKDIFKTLRDCQKYHMDYVEDITHLPINSNIVLYGPASSSTN